MYISLGAPTRRRRTARGTTRCVTRLVVTAVAVIALVGVSAPAGAELLPKNEFCSGAGSIIISDFGLPGPTTWDLTASGFCGRANFPVLGLEHVTLTGHGTSDVQGLGVLAVGGIGLCTDGLLVTNFVMPVHAGFTPVATSPAAHSTDEVWSAPVTTFPFVTPLLVSRGDDPNHTPAGVSVLFSHIFLQCGNGGDRPSLQFDWAQLF